MKKQYIYSALVLTALLCAGCAKEIGETIESGDSAAIELSSVCTDPITKAVISGTSFTTDEADEGIGLFLLDGNGKAYGNNAGNVRYGYNDGKWTASQPLRIGNTVGTLVGYYPYSEGATDVKAIPVASSINGTDWLYGSIAEITSAKAKTESLTLSHALTRLSITLRRDASFNGDCILSSLSIEGNGVAASGTLDATTGTINATKAPFTVSTLNETITEEGVTEDCLVVPAAASDTPQAVTLKFTIDGKAYKAEFKDDLAVKLKSGTWTDIELTVKNSSVEVSAASINGWDKNGTQKVVVGGNHTVTINLADTIAVHDVLSDIYVDGNSLIILASSCCGEHLKCIMANGEFCPSQSKTSNQVYRFVISDITEDITASIGYAKAVSLVISPSNNEGSVEISGGDLYEGETVSLKAVPKQYFKFAGWKNKSGDIIYEGDEYEIKRLNFGYILAEFKFRLIIDGEFTVNENGHKVKFTNGNLYNDSQGLKTEDNQYDYNAANYSNKNAHVSHFTWCNSASYATDLEYNEVLMDGQPDFFTEIYGFSVAGFSKNQCRTLTKDEWAYLFGDNTVRSGKYKLGVTVCNKKNCVVLLPDDWDGDADDLKNSYDKLEWKKLEDAGAVCLPAAGYRIAASGYPNQVYVQYSGGSGFYWSTTTSGNIDAFCLSFGDSGINPTAQSGRDRAISVRLVVDVAD